MRKLLLFLLVSIALPALAQNGKKVYADFHGVRYTRQHDGKLGRWEMYANTEKSSTGRKSLCYNADLIDSEGRHEIAAVALSPSRNAVQSRSRLYRISDIVGKSG